MKNILKILNKKLLSCILSRNVLTDFKYCKLYNYWFDVFVTSFDVRKNCCTYLWPYACGQTSRGKNKS